MIKAIKGTKDIFSPEVEKWQFVERIARTICAVYGYSEIRPPIFESTELFARSVGEVTDIVTKQMYTFTDNSAQSITLRPEATASVVRAFIENGMDREPAIHKMYYIGPMFRYERPQKGRYRQFSQFGIEVLGTEHPAVDAEVIEVLIRFLERTGISDFQLQLNTIGCAECRPRYIAALQQALKVRQNEMCADCQDRAERNPLRVLDCKVEADQPIIDALPSIDDYLCESCKSHFDEVQKFLKYASITWQRNKRLVRGLDYYTKTTFEVVAGGLGAQSSVAGGGRYDKLVEDLGGKPTKAIGFALGIDRLILTLPETSTEPTGVRIFIVATDEQAFEYAYHEVLLPLRNAGIPAEIDYQRKNFKAAMRLADRLKVPFVALIGEAEVSGRNIMLKDMATGAQEPMTIEQVVKKIQ